MRVLIWIFAMLLAGTVRADEPAPPVRTDALVDEVAVLVAGHGTVAGINRDGILQSLALERAKLRAREMARFMAADLDGDGAVTRNEVAVLGDVASATTRGRLLVAFAKADADGDGELTPPELAARAEAAAMKGVSRREEERRLALMQMDADGDGWLTLAEVSVAPRKAPPGM